MLKPNREYMNLIQKLVNEQTDLQNRTSGSLKTSSESASQGFTDDFLLQLLQPTGYRTKAVITGTRFLYKRIINIESLQLR